MLGFWHPAVLLSTMTYFRYMITYMYIYRTYNNKKQPALFVLLCNGTDCRASRWAGSSHPVPGTESGLAPRSGGHGAHGTRTQGSPQHRIQSWQNHWQGNKILSSCVNEFYPVQYASILKPLSHQSGVLTAFTQRLKIAERRGVRCANANIAVETLCNRLERHAATFILSMPKTNTAAWRFHSV